MSGTGLLGREDIVTFITMYGKHQFMQLNTKSISQLQILKEIQCFLLLISLYIKFLTSVHTRSLTS